MSGDGSDRYYGAGARRPEFDPGQATADGPARDPLGPSVSTYGRGGKSARPPKAGRAGGRRRRRGRTVVLVLLALLLVVLGSAVGTWLWASAKLTKVAALSDYDGRPAPGAGTNWLVVGSDSRSNLTAAQKSQLHVGSDQGQRTDTIMLLHYGSGAPELISIPRDSYVTIPAYTDSSGKSHGASRNKINAAYDLGGAPLLAKTVETATGVRVNHYLEIGFLGVVNVVNAVGGVNLCLDAPVKDSHSGADLPAGCQTLDGTQSLALIRTRYSLANSDISRMANQQKFVAALAKSALRPGVEFNPFTLYPFLDSALGSVAVDNGSGLSDLVGMARKVRPITGGKGVVGTVPIKNEGYQVSGIGSTVLWDSTKAKRLFGAVNQDAAIPSGLLNTIG
ncbi:LCP family protein [Actinocrinis puniceicyclus]|uniref:LCP family protein n=1 Tax=Actinocrinis puniceicyclus TaxID=977794 RepID=A0A8J7WLG5_9ACTN|nr:LCP family protein [Actinocrinis puniceicyclus]MBS2961949.1 LCP family protein [Actinocrinis puniceicyclus]